MRHHRRLSERARARAAPRPGPPTCAPIEGDVLRSRRAVTQLEPLQDGGLVHLHVLVTAEGPNGDSQRNVLDWKLVGLMP